MTKPKIIVILGPTATGKTKMAIEFAKRLNTEIISGDSMQIYKEFNILSAKPTEKELKQVKHHLINQVSVTQDFSVFDFIHEAKKIIKFLHSRDKITIISGGTGFYIDALLNDYKLETSEPKNDFFKKWYLKFENLDNFKLYEILEEIDPLSAKNIHLNDRKRVIRAISFYKVYSKSIITQSNNTNKKKEFIYNVLKIGLNFKERSILYEKINNRVDDMVKNGLLEEVTYLKRNFEFSKTAKEAIGFKELDIFLDGKNSFNEAIESIKQNTRRYAKRQLTWFRRDKEIYWKTVT